MAWSRREQPPRHVQILPDPRDRLQRNVQGQLGDGTYVNRALPSPVVSLSDAMQISSGSEHSCALRASGRVVCWGFNGFGQLGFGCGGVGFPCPSVGNSASPVEVRTVTGLPLENVVQVASGLLHSCAVRSAGDVWCWGHGGDERLGGWDPARCFSYNGIKRRCLAAVQVPGLSDAVEVAAGDSHTCARRSTGAVVCWGANFRGQIGDGSTVGRQGPTPVSGLSNAARLAAGAEHTCALRATGAVSCWGSNSDGQLGPGASGPDALTPVDVPGL